MKGSLSNRRLLRAILLVVLAMLVLAAPAAAGKPALVPLTVGEWGSRVEGSTTYFWAKDVSWDNSKARAVEFMWQSCDFSVLPEKCNNHVMLTLPVSARANPYPQQVYLEDPHGVVLAGSENCEMYVFVRLLNSRGVAIEGTYTTIVNTCIS